MLIVYFSLPCLPAAAQPHDRFIKGNPETPWHITADAIRYDQQSEVYIAEGNVIVVKDEKRLYADFIRFDHHVMKAVATGHVTITSGGDILTGSRMELDLNAETGTIYEGTLFLKENHFYISGQKIQKTGADTYKAERASISTCDGKRPAWKIRGRNLDITIEGYGSIKHASLWAKKVPVLYTPYLFFPVKLKRQSGFLPPQMKISERKGFEYEQPYFWAISESSDTTFFFDHMEKRGVKLGAEYRYILKDLSKGAVLFDFLDDKKIDDGMGDSSEKWGYTDDDDLRPNSDRYWFRMKHDQVLPYNFSAKADFDIVSDQDYLTEFKTGYTGFDETSKYFFETFGRGLDDYNDITRVNRINLNRIWPSFSLNAETRWNDHVVNRRQDETDETLQQLPFIGLDASKQPILKSPLYFDMNSSYSYFYRENGIKGHRGDLYPRVYLPFKLRNYVAIEPSIGIRETAWIIREDEQSSPGNEHSFQRGIYDIKLDLSSDIYHVFEIASMHIDRLKHLLRPQIVYEYIPHQDQDDYPFFDAADRIAEKNLITYSLVNLFTSRVKKKPDQTADISKEKTSGTTNYMYHQFSRLKLEQSYDINRSDDPEPFSPIFGELGLVLSKYFSLQTDANWSVYESDFQTHNVAARFSDDRIGRLFIEHRYTQRESETIYTDLLLKITNRLSAYGAYERNIFDGRTIESRLGFLYNTQCWSLNAGYTEEETDRKFEFAISLHGLGEVGTSIAGRSIASPFD